MPSSVRKSTKEKTALRKAVTSKSVSTPKKPATKKAAARKKASVAPPQSTPTKATSVNNTTAALEKRIEILESRLTTLVNALHTEFKRDMRKGPRGVAKSIESLLS